MNLKEGTRRLALFLGVTGAIVGGFASYMVVQDVVRTSERHQAFDRLAASDTVQQAHNSWTLTLAYTPDQAIETLRKLSEDRQRDVIGSLTDEQRVDLAAKLKCEPTRLGCAKIAGFTTNGVLLSPGVPTQFSDGDMKTAVRIAHPKKAQGYNPYADLPDVPVPVQDPYVNLPDMSDPPPSTVNNADIKTIHWTKDLGVESIETANGRTLYPAPPPNRWLYLLAAFLPFLGFFIPWGAVRSVGWVGAGFVASSK